MFLREKYQKLNKFNQNKKNNNSSMKMCSPALSLDTFPSPPAKGKTYRNSGKQKMKNKKN